MDIERDYYCINVVKEDMPHSLKDNTDGLNVGDKSKHVKVDQKILRTCSVYQGHVVVVK